MAWPRRVHEDDPEPATLVLRVEGPVALEIQHLSGVIIEKVNRFFGWRAVGRIQIRQAPLLRRGEEGPARCPRPGRGRAPRGRHDRYRGRGPARRAGAAWRRGQANVTLAPWRARPDIAIIGHSGYRTPHETGLNQRGIPVRITRREFVVSTSALLAAGALARLGPRSRSRKARRSRS